jgi:Ca2+-binding RTX toxin-like protein
MGTKGYDFLYGTDGNDFIDAGESSDYIETGLGDDIVWGGDGSDTISYINYKPAPYEINPGVFVDLASGTGGYQAEGDKIGTFKNKTDTLYSIENITGSNYDDSLYGDGGTNWLLSWDGNDRLDGRGGIDFLLGLDGDDVLIGGAGADQLDGGADIDTADYSTASAGVHASLLDGKGYTGDADGDTYSNIENLTGSDYADELDGDDGANVLMGGLGDDYLMGGGGGDKLYGEKGIDTASYFKAGAGVSASLKTGFGSSGDAWGDEFSSIENLCGSFHDDVLEGDHNENTLDGLGGDDILAGNGGGDKINGGNGIDTALYGDSAKGVAVSLVTGIGMYGDAEGDTLTDIENLTGSHHDDILLGDGGDNVLDGMAGNDTLKGGGGADTLIGGMGADTMSGGSGVDMFVWYAIGETGTTSRDMDFIPDFNPDEDKIDLHAIDANGTLAGYAKFTFINTDPFSGPAQIRYYDDGVDTYIGLNTDNVANDDATIRIAGVHAVGESWFVL